MIKRFFVYLLAAVVSLAVIFLLFLGWMMAQLPSKKDLHACFETQMYHVQLCPTASTYVPFDSIAKSLPDAVVASEDSKFFSHHGFDLDELKKSLEKNMARGFYARGGSTITQQLAKNLYLTKEKTLLRKAREALITLKLEKVLTKKEILERYLNVVQFGKNIFGVRAASEFYFRKKPADLDLLESVFLAFLLPNPEKYSQSYQRKELTPFARTRINEILDRMNQMNKISDETYASTKETIATMFRPIPEAPTTPADDLEEDSADHLDEGSREPESIDLDVEEN